MALASDAALTLLLQARDETKAAVDSATKNMSKFEKASSLAKTAVAALSGVVGSEMVGALSDAARFGAEEEASLERVRVAVENSNGTWAGQSDEILKTLQAGKDLGFHNQELNDSFALLVEQTGSTSDAMERIHLAEELARGAHIDLYTASKLLGKVTDDNVKVLGRYGINVEKGATETELFGVIQQKFGGQAEAYGKTTAGAIDRTKVAMEGWEASIGNALGPMQQYIAMLPGISSGLGIAGGALGAVSPKVKDLTEDLVKNAGGWGNIASTLAKGGLVLGALALTVEALLQVKETVDFVGDHWDVFVYALQNGKLNDIPVFGFFFGKAQQVLGVLQGIKNLWDLVSGAFSGANGQGSSATSSSNPNGYPSGFESYIPQYAEGTPYVPRTGPAIVHQGERITPAGQNGGAGDVLTLVVPVVIDGREVARATRSVDVSDARRRGVLTDPVGI